jgi:hypothetical protein
MRASRLIAGVLIVTGFAFLGSFRAGAEEPKPEKAPAKQDAFGGQRVKAANSNSGPSVGEPELAFDGPGDPKGPGAGPPGGRPPRPGDPNGLRVPRGGDDDVGGPGPRPGGPDGDPGIGPGGPGRGGDGPGRKPDGPGRGPGGPGGENGAPRHGPGPGEPVERFGGDGHSPGPDGMDFGGPRKNDPEMAEIMKQDRELGNHSDDLAAQYRRASQDEKDKLMKEVVATVNKHFEVRQQRRKLQLDRMQKELERLRGEIEHRNSQRDAFVKKRVQDLVGDGGPGF